MDLATFQRPDILSMAKFGWQTIWYTDAQAPLHAVNLFLFNTSTANSKPWEHWKESWNQGMMAKVLAISKAIDFSIATNRSAALFVELDVQVYKGWYGHMQNCYEHYDVCGMGDSGMPPINTGLFLTRPSHTMAHFARDWFTRMVKEGGLEQTKLKSLFASWHKEISYNVWPYSEDGFGNSPGVYSHHSINCSPNQNDKWECTKKVAAEKGVHFKTLSKDDVCIIPRLVLDWPVCTFVPRGARGDCPKTHASAFDDIDTLQGSVSIPSEHIDDIRLQFPSKDSLFDTCARILL
jgi:hypothetical protein